MKLQLIRNATMLFDYGGHRFLTDPYFAPRHSRESYAGKSRNPLVDLPMPPEEIIWDVEFFIISHTHSDHFDDAAQVALPKSLPLFCQPGDEGYIKSKGFVNVHPIDATMDGEAIQITRVDGHHGLGEVETDMGKVSGFILRAKNEPIVYWAGDTVLCDEVRAAIAEHKPDVIITHSSGAVWPISGGKKALIVMDAAQTIETSKLAPEARVIAVHLDSLDHGTVTRADLRAAADASGIAPDRLFIPADGKIIAL